MEIIIENCSSPGAHFSKNTNLVMLKIYHWILSNNNPELPFIEFRKRLEKEVKINDVDKINIYKKLKASEGNTVFVNFYSTSKNEEYGISDFFDTIGDHIEACKVYQQFQSNCYLNEENFIEKIKEEAEIRKIKAKDVLFKHRIGGGLIGMIPAIDWALQKYVIQKDAAKKAGEIFGFDITIYEKTQEIQIEKIEKNKTSEDNINKLMNEPRVVLQKNKANNLLDNEEIKDDDNIDIDNNDLDKKKEKKKKSYTKKYGRFALSAFTGSVSFTTNVANLLATTASVALTAATITFSFIGSAVGFGIGSYLTYQHCESLLDKFVELFIQNAKSLSNSLDIGLKYFRKMSHIYRKKKS